jgi:hypothetical protein
MNTFALEANDPGMVDCSAAGDGGAFYGTCSAWTLLRKDLMPIVFNKPSVEGEDYMTPLIGIIVDPKKVKQYVTSMSIIDSDTNHRACCLNPGDSAFTSHFGCYSGEQSLPGGTLTFPKQKTPMSPSCKTSRCEPNDDECRLQNSGATLHLGRLGCDAASGLDCKADSPSLLSNWGCANCTLRGTASTKDLEKCAACAMPQLCQFDKVGRDHVYWSQFQIQDGANNIVDVDGARFSNLVATDDGALRDNYMLGTLQCKFHVTDWEHWITQMKNLYSKWLAAYDTDSKTLKQAWQGESFGQNYMLANPQYWFPYLENEVSMYFQPKQRSGDDPKWAAQARKQSEDLRDAIIGFFYVGKTCVELHQDLDGWPTTMYGTTYHSAADRCRGWLKQFEDHESEQINKAMQLSALLCKKFNETYRSGRNTPLAGVFKFVGSTNTFYAHNQLQQVLREGGVLGKNVFEDAAASLGEASTVPDVEVADLASVQQTWRQLAYAGRGGRDATPPS